MDDETISNTEAATRTLSLIRDGHPQYKYGDLYMHSILNFAWHYARKSYGGGELGTTTYLLISAAEALGFDFSPLAGDVLNLIHCVKTMAETPAAPLLFIFPTEELDLKYLKDDQGADLNPDDRFIQRFRYEKQINMTDYPSVLLPTEINPNNYSDEQLTDLVNNLLTES